MAGDKRCALRSAYEYAWHANKVMNEHEIENLSLKLISRMSSLPSVCVPTLNTGRQWKKVYRWLISKSIWDYSFPDAGGMLSGLRIRWARME